MSRSVLIPLCDAVLYELQHPQAIASTDFVTWSQSFTAERTYNSEKKLEDAAALHVFVVPGRAVLDLSSRSGLESNRDVAIFVRQKIDVDDMAAVDALVALVEEIDEYFATMPSATLRMFIRRAHYIQSEITPFFPQRLRSLREFLGVVIVTFKVYEDEG